LAFSPDGRAFVSASTQDHTIRVWDKADPRELGDPHAGQSVAFRQDGRTVVVGSDDNTLQLWDVVHDRPLGAPLARTQDVSVDSYSLAFSPDGRKLASVASADPDGYVFRLWDVSSHRQIAGPIDHNTSVDSVASAQTGGHWPWATRTGTPSGCGI
jgi:WD40 repeat protein